MEEKGLALECELFQEGDSLLRLHESNSHLVHDVSCAHVLKLLAFSTKEGKA